MRRGVFLVAISTLLLAGPPASAADEAPAPSRSGGEAATSAATADERPPCRCGVFNTRFSIALGSGWIHHTGENEVAETSGKGLASPRHTKFDVDLAVYFKPAAGSAWLFGVALDALSDSYDKEPGFANLTQLFMGVRASYFFSGTLGSGPYVRGDVGPVVFDTKVGIQSGRSQALTDVSSPVGAAVRFGLGYAYRVSETVSIIANAEWSHRRAGGSASTPIILAGGILF
ncbi:MAG: hypothetical protein HY075_00435 [Deltaproteobacteria bacterium]|nr:hypothetical protein [Deltaproteobacteria bacterium]